MNESQLQENLESRAAPPSNAQAPMKAENVKTRAVPSPLPSLEDVMQSEKAGAHVMAARRALRKGNRDETRVLLKQAFAASPNDMGALELLGDLYLEEGEQEKAIAVFGRGAKLHPRHAAFEEKMALAQLDLAEIERDKILRQQFAEQGDTEAWQDRKPNVSAVLSGIIPGLGQIYNEQYERGAAFLGASLVTFAGWFWPLSSALRAASAGVGNRGEKNVFEGIGAALGNMGAAMKLFFWFCVLAWLATYVLAAWDAAQVALRAAENRKRSIGIWT